MRFIQHVHPTLTECLFAVRVDGAGSVFDPFPGAHHLLEHIIAHPMDEKVVELGGRFDAHTYREYQTFIWTVPGEALENGIRVIKKSFENAHKNTLDEQEKTRAIQLIERERLIHLRNPHERMMEELDRCVYSGVYGRPSSVVEILGTVTNDTLSALADIAYHPDRLTCISIVSDTTHNERFKECFQFVSSERSQPIAYPSCKRTPTHVVIPSPSKEEAFIRLDLPGIGLNNPEHLINRFATELLSGPFGKLDRFLGPSGLALSYDVFSDTSEFNSFSQINFGTACRHKDTDQVEETILEAVHNLHVLPFDENLHALMYKHMKQDVDHLQTDPYTLFDFLILESSTATNEPKPDNLLSFWKNSDRSKELLQKIFDPTTIAIARTK
jgi:predicted Zn-dependent peptidase